VDFRDFPQPHVEVEDVEALDFVTDLVDPEADKLRNPVPNLHSDLGDLGSSALFELAVALAMAITAKTKPGPRIGGHYLDYSRCQPDVLAFVGRSLLDWPRGFDRLADEVRATAEDRGGFYGVGKELGPLLLLVHNKHLPLPIRTSIKMLVKQNMIACADSGERVRRLIHRSEDGMVTVQEAASRYGVARKSLSRLAQKGSIASLSVPGMPKAPILVRDAEVAQVVAEKSECISGTEASVRLGIPRISLPSLERSGLLLPASKPRLASRGSVFFVRSSVEELENRCLAAAQSGSPPEGNISIVSAVVRLRIASSNPWANIIDKITCGQLAVWRSKQNALMYALRLASVSELKCVGSYQDIAIDASNRLTVAEAAVMLGTNASKMGELIKRGFIPARPTVEELRQFTSDFILTADVGFLIRERGHRCRWREVPHLLRSAGIEPVATLICDRGLVWPRLPVEQEIENKFPA
jgi:hypothetical protein